MQDRGMLAPGISGCQEQQPARQRRGTEKPRMPLTQELEWAIQEDGAVRED